MRIEEREIDIRQATTGMFVCRLDRPWTGTPFPMQGFLIDSEAQLETLRHYCSRVWIDVERGREERDPALLVLDPGPPAPSTLVGNMRHRDTASLEVEIPVARVMLDDVTRLIARILDDLRSGEVLSPQDVEAAAGPIVKSVLRNADAFFLVNAMRARDAYAYSHAINCAALAAAFGRTLGLPEDVLVELASGGLLLDVGKSRLPEGLLSHPGRFDDQQMAQARRHVELSLQIIGDSGRQSAIVHDMVRSHHERVDGSGYPDGALDAQIPLFARMAAIVDSFDAMTSERAHAPAVSRHDALQAIYRERGTLYHADLVEQFIGCLGVYPTGSLVELSSGQVAVVMSQNATRRLRPRVLVLMDADNRLREHFMPLDLMSGADGDARRIEIVRPLPTGAHGLDPTELYL